MVGDDPEIFWEKMPIQAMYLGKLAHGKSTIEKIAVASTLSMTSVKIHIY